MVVEPSQEEPASAEVPSMGETPVVEEGTSIEVCSAFA